MPRSNIEYEKGLRLFDATFSQTNNRISDELKEIMELNTYKDEYADYFQ